ITWIMPAVMLLIGFFIYSSYVRRNRKAPEQLSDADKAVIDRFRNQIDRELDEPSAPDKAGTDARECFSPSLSFLCLGRCSLRCLSARRMCLSRSRSRRSSTWKIA